MINNVVIDKPVLKGGVAKVKDVLSARSFAAITLLSARPLCWSTNWVLWSVFWGVVYTFNRSQQENDNRSTHAR